MKFVIEIELGNDAMRKKEHVARALSRVALDLQMSAKGLKKQLGSIRDKNGNTVGWYETRAIPET